MNLDDTIVAISSPPGSAWRGIVRLSGSHAFEIAAGRLSSDAASRLESIRGNSAHSAEIMVSGTQLPCTVFHFRAPKSYTRQDMVELHLLGAPTLLALVLEECIEAGARRADPGEFTARAFLAGALDMSQVHGIAGMIAARSDQQLQAAARLLHGDLSRTATAAREEIADLLSLVEGALDFADEPIEFITPEALRSRLKTIVQSLETTSSAALRMERWQSLPSVVLVGPPNAGKSSLLNRLSGVNRSICTAISGTTRDVITVPVALDEDECLLTDTAGLGDPADSLDAQAQVAARKAIASADLILALVDVASLGPEVAPENIKDVFDGLLQACPDSVPVVCVANKADLISAESSVRAAASASNVTLVSAQTGEGCESLKRRMKESLHDRSVDPREDAIALMVEHREALHQSVDALNRAFHLAEASTSSLANADVIAAELHISANALAAVVGQDDTEALLGRIFARFCVGK